MLQDGSPVSADGHQPPKVGVFISRGCGCCWGGSSQLWSPWPLRGISSSLQGVWQACSPNNCLCSPPPSVDKVSPLPPIPARAQCPLATGTSLTWPRWSSDPHPAPAPAPGSCDDLVRENYHLQGRVASSGSWRLATGLLPQLLSTIMRAACTDIYSEVTLMVRWYNDILEWSSTLTPKVGALLAACRRLDTCTQSPPSTVKMSGSIAMTICNICDQWSSFLGRRFDITIKRFPWWPR